MPYITIKDTEPKARPGFTEHEHDLEPAGVKFIALEVKDRGEKGIWLLSNIGSGDLSYPDKWYNKADCKEISWLEYHEITPISNTGDYGVDPVLDIYDGSNSGEITSDTELVKALKVVRAWFKGEA